MSVIVSTHCWEVLLTAATACSIQLLHDATDNVYIAVGHTLHGLCELERFLSSLWTSVMSFQPQIDAPTGQLCATSSSSSAAAAVPPDSSTSLLQMSVLLDSDGKRDVTEECSEMTAQADGCSQVSACQQSADYEATEQHTACQQVTRSGRRVKSRNSTDFMSSDMSVKNSLQNGSHADKTSRQGRPRKPPTGGVRDDVTGDTVDVASSHHHHQQQQQQSDDTATDDCVSHMSDDHGMFFV